jgi:hypothetical protein
MKDLLNHIKSTIKNWNSGELYDYLLAVYHFFILMYVDYEDQCAMFEILKDQRCKISDNDEYVTSLYQNNQAYDHFLDLFAYEQYDLREYPVRYTELSDLDSIEIALLLDVSVNVAKEIKECSDDFKDIEAILLKQDGFFKSEYSALDLYGNNPDSQGYETFGYEFINTGNDESNTVIYDHLTDKLFITNIYDYEVNKMQILAVYLSSLELSRSDNECDDTVLFTNRDYDYSVLFKMKNGDPVSVVKIMNEKNLIKECQHVDWNDEILDCSGLFKSLSTYNAESISL